MRRSLVLVSLFLLASVREAPASPKGGAPGSGQGGGAPASALPPNTKPLTEMGKDRYKGSEGGLYPDGANERPPAHEALGVAIATNDVKPLDADGKPSGKGKIVLLSVGMSNTTQEFSTFVRAANEDRWFNPSVTIVDGAQGGMAARQIANPDDHGTGERYWAEVDDRLKQAGVSRAQVEAAWIKQADIQPSDPFPGHAKTLEKELEQIVGVLRDRFKDLKIVYVSSRTYGGYAKTSLNPEPYAFETGFAVKWLVEKQVKGEKAWNADASKGAVKAPWLSWGPYLWANGSAKRRDGFSWEPQDVRSNDGTHPSDSGCRKVTDELLKFFTTDPTAKPWFVAP